MRDAQEIIREILDNNPSRAFSSEIEGYDLELNKDKCPAKVSHVVNFIHNQLYNPALDIAYVKRECMIGGNNISELFGFYVGTTPKKYINLHRIHAAKLLLSSEKLQQTRILKIAIGVGYRYSSTFIKAFKRLEGTTPARWKETRGTE